MMNRIAAVLLAATIGCGGGGSEGLDAPDQPAADAPAAAAPAGNDGALTRASFERWFSTIEALMRAAQEDPRVAELAEVNADDSVEESAARMRQHPRIVSILRDNGFTPEQYVNTMVRIIGAMFAQGALEAGQLTEVPPRINQADVQFIADNKEWVRERWARIQAMAPQDTDPEEDDGDSGF